MGFDPSRFLFAEDAAAPVQAETAADLSPPVAGVAKVQRLDDGSLIDEETGEVLDSWAAAAPGVATVAGVAATHDLPLTAPFARELNAMFSYPPPPWMRVRQWRRLCEGARKFAETKAADALALGWEPIELFGVYAEPWKRSLATDGVVRMAAGRGIGLVSAHAIEILNKAGAHNRAYRAHFMTSRNRSLFMWKAYHPFNRQSFDAEQVGKV
jgi:hypothetical protein